MPTGAMPAAPLSARLPPGSGDTRSFWEAVDAAYGRLLPDEGELNRWLLVQTLATGTARRALYGALGVQPGWRLLDVGTGFGPIAVELAGATGCRSIGLDIDLPVLGRASRVVGDLRESGWLGAAATPNAATPNAATPTAATPTAAGSPGNATVAAAVGFAAGDCTRLPFADGQFDAALSRFVLQHLPDPSAAVAEFVRVVRPGGLVCVIDVDDGLSLVYPAPSQPVRRLQDAFVALQHRRGGDRSVGRKLAGLLDAGGVAVTAVLVMPQAAYGPSSPADLNRQLLLERITSAADEIVACGLLGEDEVRIGLHVLATEEVAPTTTIEGHLAVVGKRRADTATTLSRPVTARSSETYRPDP